MSTGRAVALWRAGVDVPRRMVGGTARAETAAPAFGSLRGPPRTVVTDDGVPLHAEIDDPRSAGGRDTRPTVVFVHGFGLNQDSWHFQRATLRDAPDPVRGVYYDHRSHGRSGRSAGDHATLDQLARDLHRVIETCAPDGPVVLVGHSMGGMTIMKLAEQHPKLFGPGERVRGVCLFSTSDGLLQRDGVPERAAGLWFSHVAGPALRTASRLEWPVEAARRMSREALIAATARGGFGSRVPADRVVAVADMIAHTRVRVLADFLPNLAVTGRLADVAALDRVPTSIVCGDRDLLTPYGQSASIASELPSATLTQVPHCGHMGIVEHPRVFTAEVLSVVDAASGPGRNGATRVALDGLVPAPRAVTDGLDAQPGRSVRTGRGAAARGRRSATYRSAG